MELVECSSAMSRVSIYPDSNQEHLNWFKPVVTQSDLCLRKNALPEG